MEDIMKKLSLILILLLLPQISFSEGYSCYYKIGNESFKKEDEDLREYQQHFIILRKDNQFYEINDWSNSYNHRLLSNYDIVFESDKSIHLYQSDSDESMNSMVINKVTNHITESLTMTFGLFGGNESKCKFISDDEVWKFE
jgi:hypothetical protein